MPKFTFVTPEGTKLRQHVARVPGVRKLCGHQHRTTKLRCLKAAGHKQHHSYRDAPSTVAAKNAPKQNRVVSKITKLDCLAMIEDPVYRKKLLADLRQRKLRPAVECMLWYYAKGKPKEMVEHSGTLSLQEELSALSTEELRQRALDVAKMLAPTVH
jgi:hypothetical protein